MTFILAIAAAVAAIAVIVFMIRLAPGRTERVRRTHGAAADGQGEQLAPRDRAA